MKQSDIPDLIPVPWAENATDPTYVNDIPVSQPAPGFASYDLGFPPETMVPIGSGGLPPRGQDENGGLRAATRCIRWSNAGTPFVYDSDFSTAVGGYPKGAMLQVAGSPGWFWISTVEDNTSDPDTGGANWELFTPTTLYADDTGSANAAVIALVPAPPNQAALTGLVILVKKVGHTNSGAMTINLGFGSVPIIFPSGNALVGGELPSNGIFSGALDENGNFELLGSVAVPSSGRTVLTADTNFYISTIGSDLNNGTSSATPWATFTHAWSVLTQNYDLAGFDATVNVADGTYTVGGHFAGFPTLGAGSIIFASTSGNASACIVNVSTGNCFVVSEGADVTINNIKVIAAAGSGVFVTSRSNLNFEGMEFGACASYHIFADEQSRVNITDDYSVTDDAANHWNIQSASELHIGIVSITISLSGLPTFSNAFARAANLGLIALNSVPTFAGSGALGVRYLASFNGVINTGTANTSFLPGNSAGTANTGAQYN